MVQQKKKKKFIWRRFSHDLVPQFIQEKQVSLAPQSWETQVSGGVPGLSLCLILYL